MVRKNFTPQQIINKLREAEIHINQGIPIAVASQKIEIIPFLLVIGSHAITS